MEDESDKRRQKKRKKKGNKNELWMMGISSFQTLFKIKMSFHWPEHTSFHFSEGIVSSFKIKFIDEILIGDGTENSPLSLGIVNLIASVVKWTARQYCRHSGGLHLALSLDSKIVRREYTFTYVGNGTLTHVSIDRSMDKNKEELRQAPVSTCFDLLIVLKFWRNGNVLLFLRRSHHS